MVDKITSEEQFSVIRIIKAFEVYGIKIPYDPAHTVPAIQKKVGGLWGLEAKLKKESKKQKQPMPSYFESFKRIFDSNRLGTIIEEIRKPYLLNVGGNLQTSQGTDREIGNFVSFEKYQKQERKDF